MNATRALSLFSLVVAIALGCGRLKPPGVPSNDGSFDAGPDTAVEAPAGDAPSTDAPSDPTDAGPTCFATSATPGPAPASPAFGTISGPGLSVDICSGDTSAYLEPAQGSPTGVLMVVNGGFDAGGVRF